MYIPTWLCVLIILGLPIVGGIYREAYYRSTSAFSKPDPHPVRSWLAVIAIFAGGFAVTYALVKLAWYGSLLGLGALLDWLS